MVGLAAVPSVGLWSWVGVRWGNQRSFAIACIVEGIGVVLSVVVSSVWAVLAAAVTWAVTRPLLRTDTTPTRPADGELAVYRDQLAEIESEKAQGLIGETEAEAARAEVARRLIKRSEEQEHTGGAGTASIVRQVALYGASALPVVALGIYLAVGSPLLPGKPYEARLKAPLEQASEADLVAKVEAHLRERPEAGRGWDVIAPVYMRQGKFQQAADAYERAMSLLGETPQRMMGLVAAPGESA